MSVVHAQLERAIAWPLSMLLARTVVVGMLSALIPMGALARLPKPIEVVVWSKARFGLSFVDVGRVLESQSFSVF